MDVSPAFAANIMALPLLTAPETIGVDNNASSPTRFSQTDTRIPYLGRWFPIPDDSVTLRIGSLLFGIPYRIDWRLPDDSIITFTSDPYGQNPTTNDINYQQSSLWNRSRLSNVTVKATPSTVAGLVAYGLINREDARDIVINTPTAPAPDRGEDISGAVKFGSTALIVVALVGAAIYFLPKTGG